MAGASKNGVIITVYVESADARRNNTKKKKKKAQPLLPEPFARRGYDRRQQLLAYAHSLRRAHGHGGNSYQQHYNWSNKKKFTWPKTKKWRWWSGSVGRLPVRFGGVVCCLLKVKKGQGRSYTTDEQSEVDCLLGKERANWRKMMRRKPRAKTYLPHFWRKLRRLFIGLTCAWQCNKGR